MFGSVVPLAAVRFDVAQAPRRAAHNDSFDLQEFSDAPSRSR
jgi:hypothetical protein